MEERGGVNEGNDACLIVEKLSLSVKPTTESPVRGMPKCAMWPRIDFVLLDKSVTEVALGDGLHDHASLVLCGGGRAIYC